MIRYGPADPTAVNSTRALAVDQTAVHDGAFGGVNVAVEMVVAEVQAPLIDVPSMSLKTCKYGLYLSPLTTIALPTVIVAAVPLTVPDHNDVVLLLLMLARLLARFATLQRQQRC